MSRSLSLPLMIVGLVLPLATVRGQELTLETAPPVVVETLPRAGADGVDPATTEIKVTFSKAMTDKSWSWTQQSKDSFPATAGQPAAKDDRKTCVLPVKLDPGKTYVIWVNSAKFHNFKDSEGNPAVPYLLVFKTKR